MKSHQHSSLQKVFTSSNRSTSWRKAALQLHLNNMTICNCLAVYSGQSNTTILTMPLGAVSEWRIKSSLVLHLDWENISLAETEHWLNGERHKSTRQIICTSVFRVQIVLPLDSLSASISSVAAPWRSNVTAV